jgi:hypothetical protein
MTLSIAAHPPQQIDRSDRRLARQPRPRLARVGTGPGGPCALRRTVINTIGGVSSPSGHWGASPGRTGTACEQDGDHRRLRVHRGRPAPNPSRKANRDESGRPAERAGALTPHAGDGRGRSAVSAACFAKPPPGMSRPGTQIDLASLRMAGSSCLGDAVVGTVSSTLGHLGAGRRIFLFRRQLGLTYPGLTQPSASATHER